MRRALLLASLVLPLGGCYAPADPSYGYAPPGYPPGGYAPAYDPYAGGDPGYSYNGGAPTFLEGGVAVPLVLIGGEWGYYDHDRRWHHAPERVSRDLEAHRAGSPFHPDARPHADPYPHPGHPGGQAAFRPVERPPPASPARPAQATAPRQEEHQHHRDCPSGQRC